MAEERERQRAEIRAKQEERKAEQEAKRREWELAQLEKLEQNPYEEQIDLCEQLIYFCARNKRKTEENGPAAEETKQASQTAQARENKLKEDIEKGKVEVAISKAERAAANVLNSLKQDKKKRQRKRDGPSTFYYEDENRVDLDYATLQKFGSLELSPPTELEQLDAVNSKLIALRDALKLKGSVEQTEGKAKFTRDDSILKSEEFASIKTKYSEVDEATRRIVDKIQSSIRFKRASRDDDDAEDFGEGRPRREDRGDRGGRGQRGGARDGQ